MVAVPADRQFTRIAAMGLFENPEIFGIPEHIRTFSPAIIS
jgi:hypothetical protein